MASKISRIAIANRGFAAQAATKSADQQVLQRNLNLQQTKLPNGVLVATFDNNAPVSRVGVVVRAGPRYETPAQLGLNHALRLAAGYSTKSHSIFAITRNTEYRGGSLSVTPVDHERTLYSLQSSRDHIEKLLPYLNDTIVNPEFKQWELEDNQYRFDLELSRYNAANKDILVENLHRAAFRGSLANSIYTPAFKVGAYGQEDLAAFVKANFVAPRTAIVASGVDHESFVSALEDSFGSLPSSAGATPDSKYIGGELRADTNSQCSYVAVAGEGAAANNQRDVLALKLFETLIHSYTSLPNTSGTSALGRAIGKVAQNSFQVSTLNYNYTGTGLFGFVTVGSPNEIHSLVKAGVLQLRESAKSLNEEKLSLAKSRLVSQLQFEFEDQRSLLSNLSEQASNNSQVSDLQTLVNEVYSLKLQEVQSVVNKLVKGKGAVAAVGQVHNAPYLEDLM